ncbi:MAG: NAD-dependent succinate-semialdehyde dehydrogenase [Steroidobacteraceae bacterium]
MTYASINPTTGETFAQFELHTAEYVDAALTAAARAQRVWARTPLEERCSVLRRIAAELRQRRALLARLVTLEMGKPILESEAEVDKCAWNCEFYADNAAQFLGDEIIESAAAQSRVLYEPLGVVLAIMPWNYPLWQVLRFAAPALAAGNGFILKHANNVPQCAEQHEQLLGSAGIPHGLCTVLRVDSTQVKSLIEDRRIAAVTLTGSTAVGRQVAAQAGAALKKQVLELGGSDPFIVLEDAPLELAAQTAVKARFTNGGQSCINAKRFILVESIADRFLERFLEHVHALKVGDPLRREVNLGPMAREDLRSALHRQVQQTIAQGAQLCTGGVLGAGPGFFYPPTVLDRVTPTMTAACEETFGPVAAILRVRNAEEALHLANSLDYGLGAAVWSTDVTRATALARRIEAGAVFVNALVASDPRLPFGGIKQSGYGRELGAHGAREFTNVKTLWIGPAR